MKTEFRNKKITGMLAVIPETVINFDDEAEQFNFPVKQSMRLKRVMGYGQHRLSKPTSTASDFCIYGLRYLLDNGMIKKEEIGAIIVVTLSPDYFVPHISNIIQGELSLDEDVLCMDIAQGCCAYILGLMQAFMLADIIKDKKIVLFNTDVLMHKSSKKDRNSYPMGGDATCISIIENSDYNAKIPFNIFNDGSRRNALIIPAGGFAMPSTPETAEMEVDEAGNSRSLDQMHMDGTAVFNFVQTAVPPMLEEILRENSMTVEDVDYFIFHQPNKFMLQKLADRAGIPYEKLFMNVVEKYGNPSGASIPLAAVDNLGQELVHNSYDCLLAGFGSGLSWGSMIMKLGDMEFCELIESNL